MKPHKLPNMNISIIHTIAVMPRIPQSQHGHPQLGKSTSPNMMVHITYPQMFQPRNIVV
jgi:hypothetical protein